MWNCVWTLWSSQRKWLQWFIVFRSMRIGNSGSGVCSGLEIDEQCACTPISTVSSPCGSFLHNIYVANEVTVSRINTQRNSVLSNLHKYHLIQIKIILLKNLKFGKRDQMWMLNFWWILGGIHNSGFTCDAVCVAPLSPCEAWGCRQYKQTCLVLKHFPLINKAREIVV